MDGIEAREFVIEIENYIGNPAKYSFPGVDDALPRQSDPERRLWLSEPRSIALSLTIEGAVFVATL